MNDMEGRLTNAEIASARHDEQIATLFRISGEQTEALKQNTEASNSLSLKVMHLATTISATRGTPCVFHEALVQRVESLEVTRAEARGGWKVLCALFAASSALGSVIGYALSHVKGP
jgi:hypothetical protein